MAQRREDQLVTHTAGLFTGLTLAALEASTAQVRLLLCRRRNETSRKRPSISQPATDFIPGLLTYLPALSRRNVAQIFRRSRLLEDPDAAVRLGKAAEYRWYRFTVYARVGIEPMEEESLARVLSAHLLCASGTGEHNGHHGIEIINSNHGIHQYYLSGADMAQTKAFSNAAVCTFVVEVLLPRLNEVLHSHQAPIRSSAPPFAVACTVNDDPQSRIMVLGLPPAAP